MNSISLGSFFGVLQGPFEVPQRGLRLEEVWLEFVIWGGCQKSQKIFFSNLTSGCAGSLLLCGLSLLVMGSGHSVVSAQRLLVVAASLLAGLGSWECGLSSLGSKARGHRLSSGGPGASLLHGMWDPPRTEIKPVSPTSQAESLPLMHQGSPSKCFKTPSQIES